MKKRFRLNTIRGRISILVILSTFVSIGIFAGYTYGNITEKINITVRDSYQISIDTVGYRLEQAFAEMHNTASGLTYKGGLVSQVEDYLLTTDALRRRELSMLVIGQLILDDYSSQVIGPISFYFPGNPDISFLSNEDVEMFNAGTELFFEQKPYTRFYAPRISATSQSAVLALSRYAGNIDGRDFYVYMESDSDFLSGLFYQLKDHGDRQIPVCLVDSGGKVVYTLGDMPAVVGDAFDTLKVRESCMPFQYRGNYWSLYICVPNRDYNRIYQSVFREFSVIIVLYILTYIFLAIFICRVAYKPLDDFVKELAGVEVCKLYSHRATHTQEFDEYARKIEQMRNEICRLVSRVEQEGKQNAYLENQLLLCRINPHFIHNTLNNIRLQASNEGQKQLAETIQALNNLLYHNLGKNRVTTLRDEIRAADDYIYLQHRILNFSYQKEVDQNASLLELQLPGFVLQPMIENCFQHGNSSSLIIKLQVFEKDHVAWIILEDNGKGVSYEKQNQLNEQFLAVSAQGMGIGLSYVSSSLHLFFSDRVKMTIANREEGCGAKITIRIEM